MHALSLHVSNLNDQIIRKSSNKVFLHHLVPSFNLIYSPKLLDLIENNFSQHMVLLSIPPESAITIEEISDSLDKISISKFSFNNISVSNSASSSSVSSSSFAATHSDVTNKALQAFDSQVGKIVLVKKGAEVIMYNFSQNGAWKIIDTSSNILNSMNFPMINREPVVLNRNELSKEVKQEINKFYVQSIERESGAIRDSFTECRSYDEEEIDIRWLLHDITSKLLSQCGRELISGFLLTIEGQSPRRVKIAEPEEKVDNTFSYFSRAMTFINFLKKKGISKQQIYEIIYLFQQGGILGDLQEFVVGISSERERHNLENPKFHIIVPQNAQPALICSLKHKITFFKENGDIDKEEIAGSFKFSHQLKAVELASALTTLSLPYSPPGTLSPDFELSFSYQSHTANGALPFSATDLEYSPSPLFSSITASQMNMHENKWRVQVGISLVTILLLVSALLIWPELLATLGALSIGIIAEKILTTISLGIINGLIGSVILVYIKKGNIFTTDLGKTILAIFLGILLSIGFFGGVIFLWPILLALIGLVYASILIVPVAILVSTLIYSLFPTKTYEVMKIDKPRPEVEEEISVEYLLDKHKGLFNASEAKNLLQSNLFMARTNVASSSHTALGSVSTSSADSSLARSVSSASKQQLDQLDLPFAHLIREKIVAELIKLELLFTYPAIIEGGWRSKVYNLRYYLEAANETVPKKLCQDLSEKPSQDVIKEFKLAFRAVMNDCLIKYNIELEENTFIVKMAFKEALNNSIFSKKKLPAPLVEIINSYKYGTDIKINALEILMQSSENMQVSIAEPLPQAGLTPTTYPSLPGVVEEAEEVSQVKVDKELRN